MWHHFSKPIRLREAVVVWNCSEQSNTPSPDSLGPAPLPWDPQAPKPCRAQQAHPPLPSQPKRDVQEQSLDARLSPANTFLPELGGMGLARPPAQVLPGLRCNHSHSWILSPSMPILIGRLTLSTFKISAQGIWVGRHWGEQGRSQLLFQILQPHHLAWKRQIKCISATLLSTASHLPLSLFVGKILGHRVMPGTVLFLFKPSSAALPVSHQTRCDRMQPHLICGEGQTGS